MNALGLAVVVLAGLLVLDVLLECWRIGAGVQRRRDRERAEASMRRTVDRTGGPRP